MFSSGFKHQSVCSVGLVIFYTHLCCHLCHDSETKMQSTDFKWLTAKTKVEGLHNDDVCMDTHNSQEDMATCHRDTLTWCQHIAETLFLKENNEVPGKSFFSPNFLLINCKGAETFGHRRAAIPDNETVAFTDSWRKHQSLWCYTIHERIYHPDQHQTTLSNIDEVTLVIKQL